MHFTIYFLPLFFLPAFAALTLYLAGTFLRANKNSQWAVVVPYSSESPNVMKASYIYDARPNDKSWCMADMSKIAKNNRFMKGKVVTLIDPETVTKKRLWKGPTALTGDELKVLQEKVDGEQFTSSIFSELHKDLRLLQTPRRKKKKGRPLKSLLSIKFRLPLPMLAAQRLTS